MKNLCTALWFHGAAMTAITILLMQKVIPQPDLYINEALFCTVLIFWGVRTIVETRRQRSYQKAHAAAETAAQEKIWRTATGELIPYSDLGDQHLLNIYNMLKRKNTGAELLPGIIEEINKRGLELGRTSMDSDIFVAVPDRDDDFELEEVYRDSGPRRF